MINESLFLHFTDREMLESLKVEEKFQAVLIEALCYALITANNIYLPLSHYFEIGILFPLLQKYLQELFRLGELKNVLSSKSKEEFIVQRQSMYSKDSSRYPFYFSDSVFDVLDNMPSSNITLGESTTAFIKNGLNSVLSGKSDELGLSETGVMLDLIWKRISTDNGEGYTASSFSHIIKENQDIASRGIAFSRLVNKKIQVLLTVLHTRSYLAKTASCIMINIPGMSDFDIILPDSVYDYKIFKALFGPFFVGQTFDKFVSPPERLMPLVEFRNESLFLEYVAFLNRALTDILSECSNYYSGVPRSVLSDKVVSGIKYCQARAIPRYFKFNCESIYSYTHTIFSGLSSSLNRTAFYDNRLKNCPYPFMSGHSQASFNNDVSEMPSNTYFIVNGGINMGDIYRANQAGIQGPSAGQFATVTQVYSEQSKANYDYNNMISELGRMREYVKTNEIDADERDILVGELARLSKALEAKNESKVSDIIKSVGAQILDIAKRIGCPIIAAFIKDKMSM